MTSDHSDTLCCSFCGKSQHEVDTLISGPTVFICDECVDLCREIVWERKRSCVLDPAGETGAQLEWVRQHIGQLVQVPDHAIELISKIAYQRFASRGSTANETRYKTEPLYLLLRGPARDRNLLVRMLLSDLTAPFLAMDAYRTAILDDVPAICVEVARELWQNSTCSTTTAQEGTLYIDDWEGIEPSGGQSKKNSGALSARLQESLHKLLSEGEVRFLGGRHERIFQTDRISIIIGGRFRCLDGLAHNTPEPGADPLAFPGLSEEQARALEEAGLRSELVGRLAGVIDLYD